MVKQSKNALISKPEKEAGSNEYTNRILLMNSVIVKGDN